MERRRKLYSPVLSDRAIKSIFRMKRVLKKPMTEIADNLIQKSLKTLDKDVICEVCISEKNNQCEECYLKKGGL